MVSQPVAVGRRRADGVEGVVVERKPEGVADDRLLVERRPLGLNLNAGRDVPVLTQFVNASGAGEGVEDGLVAVEQVDKLREQLKVTFNSCRFALGFYSDQ